MNTIFINNLKIENAVETDSLLNIEGYCCHFNRANLNQEVVDAHSFDTFFDMYVEGKLNPKLNYNHDSNYIIGGIDDFDVKKDGLYMKAHINKNVAICRDMIIPNILSGDLNTFSTEGYIKDGYSGIVENEDGSYYVKDFLLTAVGVVPTPADWDAKFTLTNFINEYKTHKEEEKKEIEKASSKWYLMM